MPKTWAALVTSAPPSLTDTLSNSISCRTGPRSLFCSSGPKSSHTTASDCHDSKLIIDSHMCRPYAPSGLLVSVGPSRQDVPTANGRLTHGEQHIQDRLEGLQHTLTGRKLRTTPCKARLDSTDERRQTQQQ
jgi:hypothetical protein